MRDPFLKELMFGHGGKIGAGRAVRRLLEPELADQPQEVRPLQADRLGGPRAVAAVGRKLRRKEVAFELLNRIMEGLDGCGHLNLLPRFLSIPGSPGRTRSRCRA